MKHKWRLLIVVLIAGPAAGGLLTSRLYRGYWLSPPRPDRTISGLRSVEQFSSFFWDGSTRSGRDALLEAAETEIWISGEDPMGRLAAALAKRALSPQTPEPVSPQLFSAVQRALGEQGLLPELRPEYPYATQVVGHLALGRDVSGQRVLVAALHGGQVSNDHYPYYEMSFVVLPDGALRTRTARRYWNDYAGVEGLAHWLGAFAGLAVGVGVWTIALILTFFSRRRPNTPLQPTIGAGTAS